MKLFVPSLETPPLVDQLAVVKSGFCCKVQSVEGYGHKTFTLLPECVMVNVGARAVPRPQHIRSSARLNISAKRLDTHPRFLKSAIRKP